MSDFKTNKSFIEKQFPAGKISAETYKERMAGTRQVLTGLGKWWGRKPLILIRAILVGLILPSTDDPQKDNIMFSKIMMIDDDSLLKRKNSNIDKKDLYEFCNNEERKKFFDENKEPKKNINLKELENKIFLELAYDTKLRYCKRPEEMDDKKYIDWKSVNDYYGINAHSLVDFFCEFGKKRFLEPITVGDCFCGGGSIPFEASKLGLETFGSDLNPIAMLLTWASLNLFSCNENEIKIITDFQNIVFNKIKKQIKDWGIETNDKGWMAQNYLYLNEAKCPDCGWTIPISPSWLISKKNKVIANLKENSLIKNYEIVIEENASEEEILKAEKYITNKNGNFICPHCHNKTPITILRKDVINKEGKTVFGLRQWDKDDLINKTSDIYQEKLYCIEYQENKNNNGKIEKIIHFIEPAKEDLEREAKVLKLITSNFVNWREKGYIPENKIESGFNTNQLFLERGWNYWHQLFNPRQLLINGLLMKTFEEEAKTQKELVIGILGVNKCTDWNSKLSIWRTAANSVDNTFYNQALNTLFNYGCRNSQRCMDLIEPIIAKHLFGNSNSKTELLDARNINNNMTFWITDPPYGDAVNYDELSEFFIAWDKKMLPKVFPTWEDIDSKRTLAVKGAGENFEKSLMNIYSNLSEHMADDGYQIILFTNTKISIWAKLANILWKSGLQVMTAWNVSTETESGGFKSGNYIKGTIVMTLKKRTENKTIFSDQILAEINKEIDEQNNFMEQINTQMKERIFSEPDFMLAAYASSLKVITKYSDIPEVDIETEIRRAVDYVKDLRIPLSFDKKAWDILNIVEKFYIKGLELEKNGTRKLGDFQQLASSYNINDYDKLLINKKPNEARLGNAKELGLISNFNNEFNDSLIKTILTGIKVAQEEKDVSKGKNYIKNNFSDYQEKRETITKILDYLSKLKLSNLSDWDEDSYYADLLKTAIENDRI